MNTPTPPRSNNEFAKVIAQSFQTFLRTGSRSNQKLKPLHSAIASDLAQMLGKDYQIVSQGYEEGREARIDGRYVSKAVDITIQHNNKAVAGVAVKFIMQNYSQNSVNYFENMLGETANIRSTGIPYFQVIIMCDNMPHYDNKRNIKHWEQFTAGNAKKYERLSQDNPVLYIHTPDKTLIFLAHITENAALKDKDAYVEFYKKNPEMSISEQPSPNFDNGVIYNDYEQFMWKIYHKVMSL